MRAKIKPRIDLENRTKLETVIPLRVPFTIKIDPADVCNFRCKFCPTGDLPLMRATPGRLFGLMDFELFKKIIRDMGEFEHPIKIVWLYKDGEPLLHPRFADMVRYAKDSGFCEKVQTTTNASRLSPELNLKIIEAGLDALHISVYGMNEGQFRDFSGAKVNFDSFVANIRHFYEHRGNCEMIIKINGDVISEEDQRMFLEVFGDIADGVYIEHVMSCWPEFDLDKHGMKANPDVGIYGQPISEVLVCPYVFYSFSINSDGTASACFLDWERKLIIGDTKTQSLLEIWNGVQLLAHQRMMLSGDRKQHPICGNCDQMKRGHPDNIDAHAVKLLAKLRPI